MVVVAMVAVVVLVVVAVKVLVWDEANINMVAVAEVLVSDVLVMTALELPVTTPLGEFSRCAAFDCRPLALLDCARVLQTRIP